jgi:hypothetical protein
MGMGVSAGRPDAATMRVLTHGYGTGANWLLDPLAGSSMASVRSVDPIRVWQAGAITRDVTRDGVDDLLVSPVGYPGFAVLSYDVDSFVQHPELGYGSSIGRTKPGVGDVNDDGVNDVVVPYSASNTVRVDFGVRSSVVDIALVGVGVPALAGDVNLDGYEDLLIGDPAAASNYGRTYLLHGPLTAATTLGSAATVIQGTRPFQLVGAEVASAGDVDGDGYADLLVGTATSDVGSTLWYGPLPSGTVDVGNADALFPHAILGVAGVGDTNADGFDDFFVGTPTSAYTAAYLYLGQPR